MRGIGKMGTRMFLPTCLPVSFVFCLYVAMAFLLPQGTARADFQKAPPVEQPRSKHTEPGPKEALPPMRQPGICKTKSQFSYSARRDELCGTIVNDFDFLNNMMLFSDLYSAYSNSIQTQTITDTASALCERSLYCIEWGYDRNDMLRVFVETIAPEHEFPPAMLRAKGPLPSAILERGAAATFAFLAEVLRRRGNAPAPQAPKMADEFPAISAQLNEAIGDFERISHQLTRFPEPEEPPRPTYYGVPKPNKTVEDYKDRKQLEETEKKLKRKFNRYVSTGKKACEDLYKKITDYPGFVDAVNIQDRSIEVDRYDLQRYIADLLEREGVPDFTNGAMSRDAINNRACEILNECINLFKGLRDEYKNKSDEDKKADNEKRLEYENQIKNYGQKVKFISVFHTLMCGNY